ncbi:radical SAM/SPASM domain-containing protein [Campylobacter lari]|uniref:radical SAM/SPASM domain-containing protein n=1 Tax=Campylobacter lari TaxID=201 RepID=UPI0012CD7C6D|nr:radical SAM/SPASM domain-containing protein [Campylobacter lari]EGK7475536.1 radical SAM/SPASM domain-containing protein [Campylobacter lari]EGK8088283.1 radical SAM/SPASM domain-containing protein [Campylobacter lari]MCR2072126.1 SPASM domain-containing protein [Campylobacter lari subsp. concheus]MPB47066.1 radical SAM/SPASM domain-containing protein [Campylobacter lari]
MHFEKIYIELSDICGLKCDFCPSQKAQRKQMNLENFEKICKSVHNHAKLFTFHVLGDPLRILNLKEYLEIALKFNMQIELTTSGFYFDDEKIKLILDSKNVRQINISLGAFLSQNKISLKEYFEPILKLIFLHLENKNNSFINLRLWNLDKNFNSPLENDKIYDFLGQIFKIKIQKRKAKNRLERHVILHQARLFKWPSLKNDIIRENGCCYALNGQIAILSDGTLAPCCLDVKGDIKLGNCFEKDFNELLNSSLYIDLKEGFKQGILKAELCKRCEFLETKNLN